MARIAEAPAVQPVTVPADKPFIVALSFVGGIYIVLIVALLLADTAYTSPAYLLEALRNPELQYAIKLSLFSCSVTALLSVLVAVPLGYLLSRYTFPFKQAVDAIVDIPIILPPLVVGLSLLIFFQTSAGRGIERIIPMTYAIPGIILAQFMVACAFAVRTMHATFNELGPRKEHVALTLGCTQAQAFWRVVLPEARRGILVALTMSWARALGEFGPIMIFAGATSMRTEVLPTTVFLQLSVGHIETAVAVSLIMVVTSVAFLLLVRFLGLRGEWTKGGRA